jgi:hypothetical protein
MRNLRKSAKTSAKICEKLSFFISLTSFHLNFEQMIKITSLFFVLIVFLACNSKNESISLFNGTDLSGWVVDVPVMDTNPDTINPFIVKNGMLVSLGEPRGHLISEKEYQNYRLEVEYRFSSTPGNCGVLLHTSTPRFLNDMFPKSIEAQLMHGNAGDFWCIGEDISVPDMESRRGPKEEWGSYKGKKTPDREFNRRFRKSCRRMEYNNHRMLRRRNKSMGK